MVRNVQLVNLQVVAHSRKSDSHNGGAVSVVYRLTVVYGDVGEVVVAQHDRTDDCVRTSQTVAVFFYAVVDVVIETDFYIALLAGDFIGGNLRAVQIVADLYFYRKLPVVVSGVVDVLALCGPHQLLAVPAHLLVAGGVLDVLQIGVIAEVVGLALILQPLAYRNIGCIAIGVHYRVHGLGFVAGLCALQHLREVLIDGLLRICMDCIHLRHIKQRCAACQNARKNRGADFLDFVVKLSHCSILSCPL